MYRQIVGSGGGSIKQDSRAAPWLLPSTEAAEQVPSEKWEMSQVLICATRPYARRIYAGEFLILASSIVSSDPRSEITDEGTL